MGRGGAEARPWLVELGGAAVLWSGHRRKQEREGGSGPAQRSILGDAPRWKERCKTKTYVLTPFVLRLPVVEGGRARAPQEDLLRTFL